MKWPGVLTLSAALLTGTVGAASRLTGTIDLSPIPAADSLPCLTFQGVSSSGAAPAPAPAPPEMADMQQQLAEMEADLQDLAPGSAEYTQMKQVLDMARQALGTAVARPAASPVLAATYRQLSSKQAIGNLYVSLAYQVSPQAWRAFQEASALADPNKARVTATVAVLKGKPLAAVAAYLTVLAKHPADADALYNLGALAAFLNAPNEALALLSASEANGGPTNDLYPGTAQLNSTRGYALMMVGKSAEAEQVLKQALQLAPNLVEANRNLAAALGNQNKCAEAKNALARAFRRNVSPTAAPSPAADTLAAPERVQFPPVDADETPVLVRDVLDFSRGTLGKWPFFPVNVEPDEESKLSQMLTEYEAWTEQHSAAEQDFRRNADATVEASYYVAQLGAARSPDHYRSFLLWETVRQFYFYPRKENAEAARAQSAAQRSYLAGVQSDAVNLERKIKDSKTIRKDAEQGCLKAKDVTYCNKQAEYDDMTRQCSAVRTWNNLWRGSIATLETPTRLEVAELDRYFTAAVSYTSDPRLLRYQRAHLNLLRKLKMNVVPAAILAHLDTLSSRKDPCVFIKKNPPPSPNEALGAYEDPADNPCQPKTTLKAKALIVEVSFNCEKVGFEVGVEVPFLDVGIFVNVEEKFSAGKQTPITPKDRFLTGQGIVNPERIPQFGDPGKNTISTFGGGAGVKVGVGAAGSGVEGKAGFYVTGDGQGNLGDVGAKVETSSTAGAEVDVGIGEIGVGVEFEGPGASVSFLPSVGDGG